MSSIILGLTESGKPCAASDFKVLLLESFIPIITAQLRGKQYRLTQYPSEALPQQSITLWKSRGYDIAELGAAHIEFERVDKVYVYPLYFWSE